MSNYQDAEGMKLAANTIRNMRRENEILRAKVDTMNIFATMLGAIVPRQSVGMEEDISYKLDKRAEEIMKEHAASMAPAAAPRRIRDNDVVQF